MAAGAERADAVIAGGGAAGLALACALARGFGAGGRIVLCDPVPARPAAGRAYALAAASVRFLSGLGLWTPVAPLAQPIAAMRISDSTLEDVFRQEFLTFSGTVGPGEPFAWIVPEEGLLTALRQGAAEAGVDVLPAAVSPPDFAGAAGRGALALMLSDGRSIATPLLVAADGRGSRLREAAGIACFGWRYDQTAIVTSVAHERPHEGVARQHFLPGGPFAMLPLKGEDGSGRLTSIVWSERKATAQRLLAAPREDFLEALEQRFGLGLGAISLAGPVDSFPLAMGLARRLAGPRLALLGDAAHAVHPLAGQGLNLGLGDAEALTRCVLESARLGLDHGAPATLAGYEAGRRPAGAAMAFATDQLYRLFGSEAPGLRQLRDLGLGLVDRAGPVKDFLIRRAAGESFSPAVRDRSGGPRRPA